jgi:hypothetical protein
VTAFLIIGGSLALALAFALFWSWHRRDREELGGVSTQWVTEHRLGKGNDSVR